MRFIATSYLIIIVCLEAYCSHFTLSGFEECENSPALSFKDGDIAVLCEGEQDEGGICKLPGYSHGLEVVFNFTVPKRPDNARPFECIIVKATAFGNDTSGEGPKNLCCNYYGKPPYGTIKEGQKLNARCMLSIDLSERSLGVIGRLKLDIDTGYDFLEVLNGYSDLNVTICATHVVQWI